LAGYRIANSSGDEDFKALLTALRRNPLERNGLLLRVSFEDICRESRYFYPEDLDCKPRRIHSMLVLLGIAPPNMPTAGPWELLASEVRIAVECATVDEFLTASAASKRREKRLAAERQVRDHAGLVVVAALHEDISSQAVERWQLGAFWRCGASLPSRRGASCRGKGECEVSYGRA